ncbi:hypothetical protein M422DRAFT_214442, partial [Sphaerobolus stellatus SS14]
MEVLRKIIGGSRTGEKDTSTSQPEKHIYVQEPFRAGLLVTDGLQKATERCKAKVKKISAECRRKNRMFRDIEFDLGSDRDLCLNSLSTPYESDITPADCLRVHTIFENPQFIIDGTNSSDIVQGELGDCWFLCAVATLSTVPDFIEKICVARDEKAGIYSFIFCRDGEWVDVIIDDQLYTCVPRWETLSSQSQTLYHKDKDLYEKVARRGGKTLYFATSSQENETWVALLEKAYAKLHGDYTSIDGGSAAEALEDLTGGVSSVVYTSDIFNKDEFWTNELRRAGRDKLFGCYLSSLAQNYGDNDSAINGECLITAHAYSVLLAEEFNGKRFVKVRNPWGQSEWTGRWSDGSKEWTREWLPALDVLKHEFGDGAFIMEYEDFLNTWLAIECTQLFDDTWIQSSHWLDVPARPYPCPWQYGDLSFAFTVSEESPAIIMLSQADARFWKEFSGCSEWRMDFMLFKKDTEEPLERSGYSVDWDRSINLNVHLAAGDYILHIRLDRRIVRERYFVGKRLWGWDERKIARVRAELARSKSLASNYDHSEWRDKIVFPPGVFVGKDLPLLELESFKASVKGNKDPAQLKIPA